MRSRSTAPWWLSAACIALAIMGGAMALVRGYGLLEASWDDSASEWSHSRLDEKNARLVAETLQLEQGSPPYLKLEAQSQRLIEKYYEHPTATVLHVLPAVLFLVLALLQFVTALRSQYVTWHRWSGRLVLLLGLPIGLSGLYFGIVLPFAGAMEASASAFFGFLFLTAAALGYIAIRRRDIGAHREWMIRMFAIAMGVSMVRLTGGVLILTTQAGPEFWFGYAMWIGFAATSLVAELWIRHTRRTNRGHIARSFKRSASHRESQ